MKALIVGACLLVSSVAWAAPTLTVSGTTSSFTVAAGATVTPGVQNGPGNPSDCVALYTAGIPDANALGSSLSSAYLNGTLILPSIGLTSATIPYPMPSTPGLYEFRFWQNCAGTPTQLAKSQVVTVSGGTAPSFTVNGTTSSFTVAAGATVTPGVQNGPGNPSDCVALYAAGIPDTNALGNSLSIEYLNGTLIPPSVGLTSATVPYRMPSTPGLYEFRLWQNCAGTPSQLAKSQIVTVSGGTALSFTVSFTVNGVTTPITVAAGATVNLGVQNGPGNPSDCVALYTAGIPDANAPGNSLSSAYLNGALILPSIGLTSATIPYRMPSTPGLYEFRLWQNCATILAKSQVVTVQGAAAPSFSVPPELPRVYVDSTYVPPTGSLIVVPAGGDLQAAINSAQLGDVIELQAGATYPGKILLPNKTSGAGWITIRSSAWASLPQPGTRVGPQHASLMAKVTTPPYGPYDSAVVTQEGAHHYRFIGIEVTGTDPAPYAQGGLFLIDGSQEVATSVYQLQPTNAVTPHHIVLDRCYIHGTPTGEFIRGVLMNGLHVAIVDSYLADFHAREYDTQAAGAWNTAGPLKLVNNYLEAAGENVMFGGAPSVTASYVPADIEIRNNTFQKPLAWRPGDPSYAGSQWLVKNLLEFKDAQRVLIEGNLFQDHWSSAQTGFFLVLTPRTEYGQSPWATVSDITFRLNWVRRTTAGIVLSGADSWTASGNIQAGSATRLSHRVAITHNVFEGLGTYPMSLGGADFAGMFMTAGNGATDLFVDHNTVFNSYTMLYLGGSLSWGLMSGFNVQNNIIQNGCGYGITSDAAGVGTAGLNAYAPGWVFAKNVLTGPYPNCDTITPDMLPPDNFFPSGTSAVGFVNVAGSDYHLAAFSLYKNAGSDGKDVGADIDAVNAATACAMSGVCGN